MNIELEIDRIHRLRQEPIMSLDFETQSKRDLIKHGVFDYVEPQHETKVLVCCYLFSHEPDVEYTWIPSEAPEAPENFLAHIRAGRLIAAWNAQFEYLILTKVLGMDVSIGQMICTASQARACALPGALGNCAAAVGLPYRKDARGQSLINLYSCPNADGELTAWEDIPDFDQQAWREYCLSDVRVEYLLSQYLYQQSDREIVEYQQTERINHRGMCVDLDMARDIVTLSDSVLSDINERIYTVTDGIVPTATAELMRDAWLIHGYYELCADHRALYNKKWYLISGVQDMDKLPKYANIKHYNYYEPKMSDAELEFLRKPTTTEQDEAGEPGSITFDKRYRADLMAAHNSGLIELADDVLTFFELLEEAGGSTVSKYSAAIDRACVVGGETVVQGAYIFEGAGQTGRYSSKGTQLHNLRNRALPGKNHEDVIEQVAVAAAAQPGDSAEVADDELDKLKDLAGCGPMDCFAYLVRNMIVAPQGGRLIWSDWSSIEGRVLPWLADSDGGREKLAEIDAGVDQYVKNAAVTYGVTISEVTGDQRQSGKVQELSLGFAGGAGALKSMGRNFGIAYTTAEAELAKNAWRQANAWAPVFWAQVDDAARAAVFEPGTEHRAGRVVYRFFPEIMDGSLLAVLPSGRFLTYPGARFDLEHNEKFDCEQYVLTCIAGNVFPKAGVRGWPRKKLWSGLLAENLCQAVAADILREAILRIDSDEFTVTGTTHDEVICEVDDCDIEAKCERLTELMCDAPAWAEGLPLAAETSSGFCYSK